jgi:hypothetical protein
MKLYHRRVAILMLSGAPAPSKSATVSSKLILNRCSRCQGGQYMIVAQENITVRMAARA